MLGLLLIGTIAAVLGWPTLRPLGVSCVAGRPAFSSSDNHVAMRAKDGPIHVFDLTCPSFDRVFAGDMANDNHLGLDFCADGRFPEYAVGRDHNASEVRPLDARTVQSVVPCHTQGSGGRTITLRKRD